jgi:hypothetical protein
MLLVPSALTWSSFLARLYYNSKAYDSVKFLNLCPQQKWSALRHWFVVSLVLFAEEMQAPKEAAGVQREHTNWSVRICLGRPCKSVSARLMS